MLRHRYRFLLTLPLLFGAAVMTGCGSEDLPVEEQGLTGGWSTAGCELARTAEHVVVAGRRMPSTPAKLDGILAGIDRAGQERFGESFAGVEVDQERVRGYVYRVPSAAFDDYIRAAAQDVCLVVRDAAHSAVDLKYWHDRVLADLAYWNHEGVRIMTVGARHDGSGVEIGTSDAAATRAALQARYGAKAPLVVVESAPVRPMRPLK